MFAFLIPSFAAAQKPSETTRTPAMLGTKAYSFETLKMRNAENTKTYPILHGSTHTGVLLDLHETELAPGAVPHPPHRHAHEEMLFVREGEVELILASGASSVSCNE
jgi:quercetin dioxygenase-like cupin family protein